MYRGSTRQGKTLFEQNTNNNIQSPYLTSQELLNFHKLAQEGRIEAISEKIRKKRQGKKNQVLHTTEIFHLLKLPFFAYTLTVTEK